MNHAHQIVPREKLDFGLDGDIPKYWFANDAFKSRFFDAMSTIFPEGERYFISCVRDYRDQVTDPKLLQDIKDFMRQEGQHGIVHTQYNDRLKAQGIDVDMLEKTLKHLLFGVIRKHLPAAVTLADTAASEHMTAIMAHGFFERKEVLANADPRMRAMYAWHAMEEIEHKAVAFDVMQKVAKVGYLRRVMAMAIVTIAFNIHALLITRYMLKVDGFSRWQRFKLFAKGLAWIFGPGGLYMPIFGHYIQYYKPGFHPWQGGQMESYGLWLDTFNRTGDPIAAGEVLHAAGA
ncbi:metal-dependent hydrolase [Aquabacterium sp.]|jgi:predicted metal-dependent hydrolase|uniref:metal-dependent hydrolase n=1 Tax=Aquabacterium TaxID=92793 RepID=UPI001D70A317|nr:metal-dependent hydrolase [Aquabacterium sp.]MBT9609628.1 metal-dependent hydrolase [Aquabacterium sp.]|tara:strand:+ start:111 stop:980 length:870 start_codon:yes stop_codon:yes gene_type:complete